MIIAFYFISRAGSKQRAARIQTDTVGRSDNSGDLLLIYMFHIISAMDFSLRWTGGDFMVSSRNVFIPGLRLKIVPSGE